MPWWAIVREDLFPASGGRRLTDLESRMAIERLAAILRRFAIEIEGGYDVLFFRHVAASLTAQPEDTVALRMRLLAAHDRNVQDPQLDGFDVGDGFSGYCEKIAVTRSVIAEYGGDIGLWADEMVFTRCCNKIAALESVAKESERRRPVARVLFIRITGDVQGLECDVEVRSRQLNEQFPEWFVAVSYNQSIEA